MCCSYSCMPFHCLVGSGAKWLIVMSIEAEKQTSLCTMLTLLFICKMNILVAPIRYPTLQIVSQLHENHLYYRSYTIPSLRESFSNRMSELTI